MKGPQSALENAMDKLFQELAEIEYDYELERGDWCDQIGSWAGRVVADGYREWAADRDSWDAGRAVSS